MNANYISQKHKMKRYGEKLSQKCRTQPQHENKREKTKYSDMQEIREQRRSVILDGAL